MCIHDNSQSDLVNKLLASQIIVNGLSVKDFIECLSEMLSDKAAEKVLNKLQDAKSANEGRYISIDQTRKLFHPQVTRATIHNWAAKGLINKKRIGSKVVFDREEVLQAAKTLQKYKHNI